MNINTWQTPGKADILNFAIPPPWHHDIQLLLTEVAWRGSLAVVPNSGKWRKSSWNQAGQHTGSYGIQGNTGHDFHGKHLQIAPTQVTLWILFVAKNLSKILAPGSTSWKMEDVVVHPLCIEVCQGLQVVTPTGLLTRWTCWTSSVSSPMRSL